MPEFHQIEGIIHEPDASLPMLISTLKTFYSKMGYPDVRVRPAYFPYTNQAQRSTYSGRGVARVGRVWNLQARSYRTTGYGVAGVRLGHGPREAGDAGPGLDDIRQLYQPT